MMDREQNYQIKVFPNYCSEIQLKLKVFPNIGSENRSYKTWGYRGCPLGVSLEKKGWLKDGKYIILDKP